MWGRVSQGWQSGPHSSLCLYTLQRARLCHLSNLFKQQPQPQDSPISPRCQSPEPKHANLPGKAAQRPCLPSEAMGPEMLHCPMEMRSSLCPRLLQPCSRTQLTPGCARLRPNQHLSAYDHTPPSRWLPLLAHVTSLIPHSTPIPGDTTPFDR